MAAKWISRLLGALLVLAIAAALAGWQLLRASRPFQESESQIAGLEAPVSVRLDDLGRPFVEAGSLADALATQGWLHARDRLWQMELFRRAGSGRMAEMLGPGLVDTDRQLWRFGVPQLAARLGENTDAELRGLVNAYVAGVNAAIEAYPVLPPEFLLLDHKPEPWTPRDVYALGALMAFQSAGNARQELLRQALLEALGPERFALFLVDGSEREGYPFVIDATAVDHPDPAAATPTGAHWLSALRQLDAVDPARQALMPRLAFGSNGWVVAPWRSTTGSALYAFDSHDNLGLPNLFYEVHLFFSGGRQIRGWSVPGLPGVINGYNEAIAWGFTNIGDTQDLFLEQHDPSAPGMFVENGESYQARVETVSIAVKDGKPVDMDIVYTRNGPLISETPPVSLRWTVQDVGTLGLDGLLAFNLAGNWAEFNAALDRHAAPTLNATYADREGNIGFRTAGLLPRRGAGTGLYPLPAGAEHRWQGLVPSAEMPRLANPESGYIAAANARVQAPGRQPLVAAENAAPYRIGRLQAVLGSPVRFSPVDMQALQMDWYDSQAAAVLPAMLEPLAETAWPVEQAMLRKWLADPIARRDSSAALLFQTWYLELAGTVFEPALGSELYQRLLGDNYVLNHALETLLLEPGRPGWWPRGRAKTLAVALGNAVQRVSATQGNDPQEWRLDRAQQVGMHHELSKAIPALGVLFAEPSQPWAGSPATVGRANYRYRRAFDVSHGATVRAVASLGERIDVWSVIPGGQSGHPLSRHYADQFPAWLAGELHPVVAPPSPTITLLPAPRE